MNWQLLVFIVTSTLLTLSNGQTPSVSLTVDGGGTSLVGDYCPGRITLTCNATDLTFLQWTFNGNTEIELFVPDDSPTNITNTNNPAFLNLELRSILRNDLRANYLSILTADLSLLQSENIIELSCGGPTVQERVPVNVNIIRLSVPETPNITAVTATYSSGVLTFIEVMWMKLDIPCPGYEDSLFYEVGITSVSPAHINHTSCSQEGLNCSIVFPVTINISEYEVFLSASNSEGSSQIGVYPQRIDQTSDDYFSSEARANFTNCRIEGSCVFDEGLNTTCSVRYTRDPMYNGPFSDLVESPFVFTDLSPQTIYYLEFSAIINQSLQLRVINRLQISTECMQTDAGAVAAAVTVPVLFMILLLVIVVVTLVVVIAKHQKNKGYYFEQNGTVLIEETRAEVIEETRAEVMETIFGHRHVSTQTYITGDLKSASESIKDSAKMIHGTVLSVFTGKTAPQSRARVKEEDLVTVVPIEQPTELREQSVMSHDQGGVETVSFSTQTEDHDRRFPPLQPVKKVDLREDDKAAKSSQQAQSVDNEQAQSVDNEQAQSVDNEQAQSVDNEIRLEDETTL